MIGKARQTTENKKCRNCGGKIGASQKYCPQCGQSSADYNLPLGALLEEAAEAIFHFDTKSVRTIRTLVMKPGLMSSEFVDGKRAGYVAPVRLYVFVSFLFFLLLTFLPVRQESAPSSDHRSFTFGVTVYGIDARELQGIQPAQIDSIMQALNIPSSEINKYILRKMAQIGTGGLEEFRHALLKGISYMMFALMPLFAFFVYTLNRKKAKYYIGTLIFSIHYHTFIFILFMVLLAADFIAGTSWLLLLPFIVCPIYLFLALRRVYRDSLFATLAKRGIITIMQFVSMVLLFSVTIYISVWTF